jgi:ATP-dependent helicase/nuclease subunit A
MPEALIDQAARRRIVTDLGCSLIVEAGAGSGKTHEMAARMAAGIASGDYQVQHIAAVTFTRKAAAELRGRFQLALEALEQASGSDPVRLDRIRGALANLERLFAGTIHAFCARLLRERPIEAHVSPGFTELDDVEERLLRRQSWRDFRSAARAAGNRDLALLSEAGIQAKNLDKALDVVCLHEDVEFAADDVPPPDGTSVWAALAAFWESVTSRLPAEIDEDTSCPIQQAALEFRPRWRFATPERRTPARLAELIDCWDFGSKVTQNRWPSRPIALEVRDRHESFRTEVVTPHLTAWRQHLYAPCLRILTSAREVAAAERRRRNVLSFNDLLLQTARVLRENASVRAALQQKYRHLFVDEFQDTDPVQAEIMLLLEGRPGPTPFFREPAAPATARTLFVVGDPKQSIYRFRRADISIYNDVRAHLAGSDGAGLVSLTTNFRSVPDLCHWVNRVFEQTFPATPDEWQPQYAPLVARREPPGRPAVRTLTVPATVEARDVIDVEADAIARYIRSAVDAGHRGWRDFLVLTRKKRRLQPYARALERLQIPLEVSGAGAFGASREVGELAELLLALVDPQDGVALVGVLRGRFFGLSDPQLFAYRQAGGYFGLFDERSPADPAAQPVAEALATLRRWYKWTRRLPAGAALDRVLEDSGFLALAAASSGGVEAGDLLHAVDRVRAAVEAGFTLAEAAEALTDIDQESTEVESLPLEPGRQDVVRLMNLHKAKGLEAAVVFLADPNGGFEPRVDVRVVRDGPAARGYFPIVLEFDSGGRKVLAEPPGWPQHQADEARFLDAEARRLLYVAATRAKDVLVVGRWAKNARAANSAWAPFGQFLSGAPELIVPDDVRLPAPSNVDLSAAAAGRAMEAAEARHARVLPASWAATSVTAEIKRLPRIAPDADEADAAARPAPASGGDAHAAGEADPTAVVTRETPSRRADAGMAWGTLVHGLLEHAMRHRTATRADLRRLALWLTMETPDLRVAIDRALDTVEAMAGEAFWQQARASSECHEEVPFAIRDQDGALPTLVNGTIDLVYGSGGAWRLVDYKTDREGADGTSALEELYAAQIRAYERAWRRVSKGEVVPEIVSARKDSRS